MKLDILFKNRTKYTENIYNKFLDFHSNHYKYSYTLYTALMAFLILFFIVIQVKIHRINVAILLCIAIVGFLFWRLFYPIFKVSKEYESDKIQNEKEFTFSFFSRKFTIEADNNNFDVRYFKLYKVFETKDFFYLYIDKTHSFLIDKKGFTKGSATEFSEFIRKKCWRKYKNVKEKY